MKAFIKSAMILLALYAQAASADAGSLYVLSDTQQLNNTTIESFTPTFTLSGSADGLQLVAFASINTIHTNTLDGSTPNQNQRLGFGLHQQHGPQMYSQIVVKQHPFSETRTLTSAGFKIEF